MTPINPPPGLLDKVAEAIAVARVHATFSEDLARAAWDAVAEGLGLSEETRTGVRAGDCDGRVTREPDERRLVSKWEPQP